jgi:hypothetical protein
MAIDINVFRGLTPYILVQIYTYTVKMEAVRSSETSVCFSLSTQHHEQGTYNLHLKWCLYVQKLWTKSCFANFHNLCVWVMKYSVECVGQNGSDSCGLYDRGGLNPTRGEWKIKADGRRDVSNNSLVKKEIKKFQITASKMQRFLIYLFLQTLYIFWAVPSSIIRST